MRKVTIHPEEHPMHATGLFHCWGQCFVEERDFNGSYSVAIIELEDGRIAEVLPEQVKFLTPPDQEVATLRDQFALQAISTALSSSDRRFFCQNQDKEAVWAYEIADAMLKARTEKKFNRAERIAELEKEVEALKCNAE
ncbi:hypothetical protein [Janthinobacterium sp. B9-8]|uniref:hypothetical protein n=1 Tax=Janthinobacterium sp. B9-8 TaxID=1236179 RepID=UPI000A6F552A|nr:hypothetical protein [Janthinobacterium sp. B9-8]